MTPDRQKTKPPTYLRPGTKRWWTGVATDYELEPHHCMILTLAAETWDEITQAREYVAEHGATFTDRFGQPKDRPEVGIMQTGRLTFAKLLRELGLDIALPDDPRPPSRSGRRTN